MRTQFWIHILVLIGLETFVTTGLAQDVELSVQTGHSAAIRAVEFSPGDEIIASAGDDNRIILWDFLTSKQYGVLPGHRAAVTAISFHPTEKVLLSASLDSTIRLWNLATGKCIDTLKLPYAVHVAAFHPDGKSFAVGGRELAVLSYPSLDKKGFPFQPRNEFTSLCFSNDGAMIAFGGANEDLAYVVSLRENALFKKIAASATDFRFDTDAGTLLYATSGGIAAEIGITERSRKSTSTDWMLNAVNAVEANASFLFAANDNGEIRVFDRADFSEQKIYKTKKSKINAIRLSHNGHYLASAGADRRIIVWDVSTGLAVKSLKGAVAKINAIKFSADGNEMLIGYENGSVRRTNLLTNQSLVNSPQSSTALARFGYSVYDILSFDKDSAVLVMYRRRQALDEEGHYDKINEYIAVWHFKENLLLMKEQKELSGQPAIYMADRKNGIDHSVEFLLNPLALSASCDDGRKTCAIAGNRIMLFNRGQNTPVYLEGGHTDRMTAIAYNEKHGFIATAGWDGMIRFRDALSGDMLTTFGAFGGGQFIYINPEGYYFSSKRALDYIGFKMNGRIYSFEQFDIRYNRPDLVAGYLPYYDDWYVEAYRNAYLKRLKKLGISEADFANSLDVPTLTFERNLDRLILEGKIDLAVHCEDQLSELDRLHIRVNGVPEFGRFGKAVSGHSFNETFTVELNPGTNYIQLYVTNKNGLSSYHESFSIEAHKKDVAPDLYLVSIGASAYRQSQYNLNFARKDAEDIERYFSWPGVVFDEVKTKLLVDSSVTLSNIYALSDFLSQARPDDVIILFIAGHGVLDDNLDYYLASHDMDFKNPAGKGIAYEVFDDLLDKTKSRKKVMFVDACHSGEIDKDEVIKSEVIESEQGDIKFRQAGFSIVNKDGAGSFDLSRSLFADMRLNNGTTVVSSAGGSEYAIEGEMWQNGAFTYCLLYGLSSKKADLDGNRVILLSELQEYLLFEVNRLTGGAQTPTSRVENLNNDFRLK